MIKNFMPFVVVLFLWAIATLYVFVKTPNVAAIIKIAVVPLAIAASVLSYQAYEITAGRAKEVVQLPERFIYLGHTLVINEQYRKERIEVWTRRERTTQLYSIAWSSSMEKAMNAAAAMKKGSRGGEVEMNRHRGPPGNKSGAQGDEYPYDSKLKLPEDERPKQIV